MRRRQGVDFVEFVANRSAALFRTAYVLTGDRHTAEDLVQGALEKACRRWNRVAAADSPEAYVRRILVNLANDRWRGLGYDLAAEPPDGPDPRDAYQGVEHRDQLTRALHALPIGMRTVIVLHYLHDMGDAEIAAALGVTPSSVRSQLSRGLARLRAVSAPAEEGSR